MLQFSSNLGIWKAHSVHGQWPCATSPPINSPARLGKYVRGAFAAIFAKFCYSGWSVHASTIHVPGPGTFLSNPSLSHVPCVKPRRCIFGVLSGIFLILDVCMLVQHACAFAVRWWPKHELVPVAPTIGLWTCSGKCPR
jgi:hypothetical protein